VNNTEKKNLNTNDSTRKCMLQV